MIAPLLRYPDDYTARCWKCNRLAVERRVYAGDCCKACRDAHTQALIDKIAPQKPYYDPGEGSE
jgi:hypothetical protein